MITKKILLREIGNILQSIFILMLMIAILAFIGLMIFGFTGLVIAIIIGLAIVIFSPKISPKVILRMYNAKKIPLMDAEGLYKVLKELSDRAGLFLLPALYYVPIRTMNAFSVGNKKDAAIALSDGLLRNLNWNELTGVLAHEVSHIKNNDLWIMGFADLLSRLTNVFSTIGQIILIIYLPIFFITGVTLPFLFVALLIMAPMLSIVLQLSLSRTREYEADLNAVKLTGTSDGLISALKKIEVYPVKIWDILIPGRRGSEPSILRTHPHLTKRIQRLINLTNNEKNLLKYPDSSNEKLSDKYNGVTSKSKRRIMWPWF